jgi:hypothetical protein
MDQGTGISIGRPTTHQGDLTKLPRALTPLLELPQWGVWRWTSKAGGGWQKPPYRSCNPLRNLSTGDPDTWSTYADALAAVQAKEADGISFVLTPEGDIAAADLDHCRDPGTGSLSEWAQGLIDQAASYVEITPSGTGLRIIGTAIGEKLHRKFDLPGAGKLAALELFRRTHKAITVTVLEVGHSRQLGNIDRLLNRAATWAEANKRKPDAAPVNGFGRNSASPYCVEEIDRIIREGALDGANRSSVFHTIVGHLCGCGWSVERIVARLEQFPDGIAGRYIGEGRLSGEVARSFEKYRTRRIIGDRPPWSGGWQEPTPTAGPREEESSPGLKDEPPGKNVERDDEGESPDEESYEPLHDEPEDDDEEEPPGDEPDHDEADQQDSKLPLLYAHGDPDPRPVRSWLVKHLFPQIGHGLISGQWGTYKTFVTFDLAACVMTGQPFLNRRISRQSGVLFVAAEGAGEVRLRINAVVREKCAMQRAPFRWYEVAPTLLQRGAVDTLVAMAKRAETSLQQEFGLPLGLVIIDTIAASAGYNEAGAENDNAVGQAVMNVLAQVAEQMKCCVLGVDHFGKNISAGTRGGSAKESSAEVVLAVLGERDPGGRVANTRVALRKVRGAQQGEEFYFMVRRVEDPEPDEDGDPVSTLVIDWQSAPPAVGQAKPEADPWQDSRQSDTRQALVLLRRVLMAVLADKGTPQQLEPDSPTRQAVDLRILRTEFCAQVAADGTPEQKRDFRKKKFRRALDHAQEKGLVGIREIGALTYVWLTTPDRGDEDDAL